MTTKAFPLADVISAHSGIMIVDKFQYVAAVMDHVLGHPHFDMPYPAAHAQVRAALEAQHPFLATLDVPAPAKGNFTDENIDAFLAGAAALAGATELYISPDA